MTTRDRRIFANSSWRLVGGEKANFCPFKRDRENEIDNNTITYVIITPRTLLTIVPYVIPSMYGWQITHGQTKLSLLSHPNVISEWEI